MRSDGHPCDAIHYREYKLILRPERFPAPDSFHEFGKLLHGVAGRVGVGLAHHEIEPEERLREVVFYDTPRFHLYEGSFIVRKRTCHRDGWPTSDPELTFKFRHPDIDTASAIDVRPAASRDYRVKFKEELLPLRDRAGGMRSLFSHTCELRVAAARSEGVATQAQRAFPALRLVLPRTGPPLGVVQGVRITEVQESLGLLDFGHGAVAKATVALWRPTAIGPAVIGEFSYQVRFERESALHRKSRHRADELFVRLQTAARRWLMLGVTKTAVVYSAGKAAPRHHE